MIAGIFLSALLLGLAVFQIALASGAPLGRFAWGGQHRGTLPSKLRIASGTSLVIYGLIAVVVLDRSGLIRTLPEAFAVPAMWVVFGYFSLGILMNAISRSAPERWTMVPLTILLSGLSLVVAMGAPSAA